MIKILLILSLGALLLISPFIGTLSISPSEIFDSTTLSYKIFFEIRLPRTLLAFFAGITLALSGLLFQNIFRNILMTPYTLGISSGAVLGAGIAIKLGIVSMSFGLAIVSGFGFIGALLTVILLLWLSRYLARQAHTSLLLLGIALSFFYTSVLMLLFYVSDAHETQMIIRFTMGSLSTIGYLSVVIVSVSALLLFALSYAKRYELQLLSVNEESAQLKGVDTKKLIPLLLLTSSLSVGALVSITGPIGFVGLVVPHIVRIIYKQSVHKLIIPTAIFGGLFMVFMDVLARSIVEGVDIPISIVTAFIGGPFFIYLILSKRN